MSRKQRWSSQLTEKVYTANANVRTLYLPHLNTAFSLELDQKGLSEMSLDIQLKLIFKRNLEYNGADSDARGRKNLHADK